MKSLPENKANIEQNKLKEDIRDRFLVIHCEHLDAAMLKPPLYLPFICAVTFCGT